MEPKKRIDGVDDSNRSGDVILLPAKGVGHTQSTHGSLRESDTDVPFIVFGTPVSKMVKGEKPVVFCQASHVDITPTVLNLFNIYKPYRAKLDGKPLLDGDLNINYKDFHGCRGSGASDFLLGRWKNFEGEHTQILLHNPSWVSRDAVLLYYGWREDFRACQIVRLSPHDMVSLEASLTGGGPLQIRAAPVQKEERPGGLVGYIRSVRDPKTRALTQFILEDQASFNIKKQNLTSVRKCACNMLGQKQSPLQKVFCP